MKKLEAELLFQEFEDTNIQIERKIKKLDTIILYYMEENMDKIVENNKDEEIKDDDSNNIENNNKSSNNDDSDTNENSNDNDKDIENDNISDELPHKKKIDNIPQDIKLLYRKIMIKTHPDKSKDETHDELYKKAVKAKNDNDIATLLLIAYNLNIKELYTIDDKHLKSINSKISNLKQKLTNLNNNPFWIWYHTDNKHLKRVMIDQITKMRKNKS